MSKNEGHCKTEMSIVMKSSKKKVAVITMIAAVATMALPAFASSSKWSATLPGYRNPTPICSGTKSNNDPNAVADVESGKTGGAYFYIMHGDSTVAQSAVAYMGNHIVIPYTQKVSIGQSLTTDAGNNDVNPNGVPASGIFNFS